MQNIDEKNNCLFEMKLTSYELTTLFEVIASLGIEINRMTGAKLLYMGSNMLSGICKVTPHMLRPTLNGWQV